MGGRGGASSIIDVRNLSNDELIIAETESSQKREKLFKQYFQNRKKLPEKEVAKRKRAFEKEKQWNEALKAEYKRRHPRTNYDSGKKNPDPTIQHRQTTTTYERARKRRIKQFDDWFFG